MSAHIVSDLHGAQDALPKAVPEGSTLVLLGDLINLIDYFSMTGILVDIFSAHAVGEVVRLRTEGRVAEAGRLMRDRSAGREDEVRREIGRRMTEEYERVFMALPDPTYLILGNVDNPAMVSSFEGENPGVISADRRTFEIDGERFGFAGGALPTPLNVAGEISAAELRKKLDALGQTDVLCTHIPADIPELCYDTVAGKPERGSSDILEYIRDVQPRLHYFGHVHQPLVSSLKIGRTVCVNVGYFRATERAWPHQPPPRVDA